MHPKSALVGSPPMELAFLSAVEQARLVRTGEVSATELVTASLERIERLDPVLNAFVTICGDEALAVAAGIDATSGNAPFRGVPIGVKDLAPTAGIRTTYSSRAYADHVPDFDSAVVRRIREAGFVIVGKTNTPEFGTVAFTESELNGATRNPWNTELTPGGSSGGAAAALAAGLVPRRPRDRRRRLDPNSRLLLRPLRAEAVARARLERAVRIVRGPLDRRAADAIRRGRGTSPRRPRRLRAGRSLVGAASPGAVRERRPRSLARLRVAVTSSPPSTSPSIRSASPP
jgi:hypothetical protein